MRGFVNKDKYFYKKVGYASGSLLRSVAILSALFYNSICISSAKEGMWIPATLGTREADMKLEGLQIPVRELYNEDGTGLNNAIVLFGRGCTGELISSKGLILTNHHCGYGSAQRLSTADKDYFSYGYWAHDTTEELPCAGLTVTFIRSMADVTAQVTEGLPDTLNDKTRDSIAMKRITAIEAKWHTKTGMEATVKPFFQSNQYWVIISQTYTDIRLVGFPPNSIGKYGGDAENWIWPRHTGDFSVFRVYAGADNQPAPFNKANKRFSADKYFKINLSGAKEGDFTMVYGFPGTTDEYAFSGRLKQVTDIIDPIAIEARTLRLNIWNRHMDADRNVFLQYTAKNAGVANGWKKWQGELKGLTDNHVFSKKLAYEKEFDDWAKKPGAPEWAPSLTQQLKATTANADSLIYTDLVTRETALGVELIAQAAMVDRALACLRLGLPDSLLRDTLTKITAPAEGFYKNYDPPTDQDEFNGLMALYITHMGAHLPSYIADALKRNNNDLITWGSDLFSHSALTSFPKCKALFAALTPADSARLLSEPAWQLYHAVMGATAGSGAALAAYSSRMRYLNRLYMNAQMRKDTRKPFYPDANLTLRLTYGKVAGMVPDATGTYCYHTTLSDVIASGDSTNADFRLPKKLIDLYQAKDFGRWAVNGDVPVAFIAANHTSGGNSGSPVLNARGELIGTNFDRAYEGTMSDYYFDPTRCRNISVDIRYTLFIIDKFGGASWLIDEMEVRK